MEKIKKWKLQFIIVALGQAISMLENISPEKMGRAFSILTLISSVTMLIGLIFSSSIAEKVGVNIWFLISGFCMIMLTVLVVIRYILKASFLYNSKCRE